MQVVDIVMPVMVAGATWFLDRPPHDVRGCGVVDLQVFMSYSLDCMD